MSVATRDPVSVMTLASSFIALLFAIISHLVQALLYCLKKYRNHSNTSCDACGLADCECD